MMFILCTRRVGAFSTALLKILLLFSAAAWSAASQQLVKRRIGIPGSFLGGLSCLPLANYASLKKILDSPFGGGGLIAEG